MYKHLFGPVPSRRLGISLGVDLVPHKVCSFNCIYCECGSTTLLTLERDEYVPVDEVLEELKDYFQNNPDPDYITFSGAGEPTLHSGIGKVLSLIRGLRPAVKVALITNGTLFSDPGLRKELLDMDVVLPSLDAATDTSFRRINRPVSSFSLVQYVKGLIDFEKEFRGEYWLETLILPGYNDDPENILSLGRILRTIKPDRIQLNTLDRPGVIDRIRPATRKELETIAKQLDAGHVEIVVPAAEREESTVFRADIKSAILETISRRPCTIEDAQKILGIHIGEVNKYLHSLEEEGRIETKRQERGIFYQVMNSELGQ
ncbi:MAG: radical SAM protein [Bacteroidetes bacterium]|nr:radical SAM protein [Bacteroidota bacterium]